MTHTDLLRKIQALLELANAESATENERNEALKKALLLQKKYKLEQALGGEAKKEEDPMVRTEFSMERTPGHESTCSILRAFFNVKVVSMRYDPPYKVIVLGRRSNVRMAKYIYDFLIRAFDSAWNTKLKQEGRLPKRTRDAFYRGMYLGLKNELEALKPKVVVKSPPAAVSSSREIVLARQLVEVEDKEEYELEQFFHHEFPNAGKGKPRTSRGMDRGVLLEGMTEGRRIRIKKPIEGAKITTKLLH